MICEELANSMEEAYRISRENLGSDIWFYTPSFVYYKSRYVNRSPWAFPSISVTGSNCALNCKHCGGKILRTMIPAKTPDRLLKVCGEIKRRGGVGCLISGGCTVDGRVPLGRFIDAIAEVKRSLNLTVVVHTGLIDYDSAKMLREAGVDAALIDIIGSDETIREVYNLNATVDDYERSLEALNRSGIPTVPHILVGLHYGRLKGEFKALRMIAKHSPSALIIIVLFPIRGTLMEDVKPPPPSDVVRVLVEARSMMPRVPLALGCARPKGDYRALMDVLAVRAGVNGIAFPAEEAIMEAEKLGLRIKFSPLCCSQIIYDLAGSREGWS